MALDELTPSFSRNHDRVAAAPPGLQASCLPVRQQRHQWPTPGAAGRDAPVPPGTWPAVSSTMDGTASALAVQAGGRR